MVTSNSLLSSVVTGVLLVAVALVTLRFHAWRRYSTGGPERESVVELLERPETWTVGFFVLCAVVLGGAIGYLNGAVGVGALFTLGSGLLIAYVLSGVYYMARSNGHPQSHAVAESIVTLGAVFILGIVVQVVLS